MVVPRWGLGVCPLLLLFSTIGAWFIQFPLVLRGLLGAFSFLLLLFLLLLPGVCPGGFRLPCLFDGFPVLVIRVGPAVIVFGGFPVIVIRFGLAVTFGVVYGMAIGIIGLDVDSLVIIVVTPLDELRVERIGSFSFQM